MTHAIRPVDFDNLKTMTYEVTGRVARITFNRPEKGNAIVADTPLELSALVERADLDPNVHVILVSGRGEGFCAGFDLSAYAEGSSSAGGGSPLRGHRAVRQDAGRQPSARSAVGPDDRLPDDEPVRPRLRQPDARRQADRGEDPRLLRGRRHRHRPARRPGDRGRRRQDRVSADAGVGCPRRRACGRTGSATSARNAFCSPGIASPAPRRPNGDWPSRRPIRPTSTSAPSASSSGSPPCRSTSSSWSSWRCNTALLQPGRRHQPDGQHRLRRHRAAYPRGSRVRRRCARARLPGGGAAAATSRSATTAARTSGV